MHIDLCAIVEDPEIECLLFKERFAVMDHMEHGNLENRPRMHLGEDPGKQYFGPLPLHRIHRYT